MIYYIYQLFLCEHFCYVCSYNSFMRRFFTDGESSLLSLVKAFDSILAVYEGFCNLKQVTFFVIILFSFDGIVVNLRWVCCLLVDLKLKICRGDPVKR